MDKVVYGLLGLVEFIPISASFQLYNSSATQYLLILCQ